MTRIQSMQLQFTAQKGLVINDKDEILLIREKETNARPEITVGKLSLPGGKIDFGEQPDAALIREVQEETGVTCKPGIPFYCYNWQYEHNGNSIQITAVMRTCQFVSGEPLLQDSEVNSKIDFVGWVPISDLSSYKVTDDELPGIDFFLENRETLLQLIQK